MMWLQTAMPSAPPDRVKFPADCDCISAMFESEASLKARPARSEQTVAALNLRLRLSLLTAPESQTPRLQNRWNPEEADNDAAPLDRAVFPAPGDSRKEPHFGHSFDARPEDRRPVSKLSPKGRTAGKISAGNFQVPQLLGDSGPSYYDLPTEHGKVCSAV